MFRLRLCLRYEFPKRPHQNFTFHLLLCILFILIHDTLSSLSKEHRFLYFSKYLHHQNVTLKIQKYKFKSHIQRVSPPFFILDPLPLFRPFNTKYVSLVFNYDFTSLPLSTPFCNLFFQHRFKSLLKYRYSLLFVKG